MYNVLHYLMYTYWLCSLNFNIRSAQKWKNLTQEIPTFPNFIERTRQECLRRAGFELWDLGGADHSPMMQYKPQVALEARVVIGEMVKVNGFWTAGKRVAIPPFFFLPFFFRSRDSCDFKIGIQKMKIFLV